MRDAHPNLQAWQAARSLGDIGELTARWIEGALGFHPCYGSGIDSETISLRTILAQFNRQGFVTTFSQPAEAIDEFGSGQRACVDGYAEGDLAKRLAALGLYTDLLVLIYEPDVSWGYQIPVSVYEFHPHTWCGAHDGFEELECFADTCSKEAMASLQQAWKVTVIDLQWGRESFLWEQVATILRGPGDSTKPYSVVPSPDLELDRDFVYY
jgi:hypothetical protein